MNGFPQALRAWFAENEVVLQECGVTAGLQRSPEDGRTKTSAWLTMETGDRFAVLIVWSSGEAELEYGNFDSGRMHQEHRDLRNREDLLDSVRTLLRWVQTQTSASGAPRM